MLAQAPIIAFAATTDPPRARRFYQDALGLKFVKEEPYALVFDAGGTMLRIARVEHVMAAPYTILGWQVPDVRAAAQALIEAGVEPARFAGLDQDELGVWSSPGGARIMWFKDPDGNTLSLTQF